MRKRETAEAQAARAREAASIAVRPRLARTALHNKEELIRGSATGRPLYNGTLQHFAASQSLDFLGEDIADVKVKQNESRLRLAELDARVQQARLSIGLAGGSAPAIAAASATTTALQAQLLKDDGSAVVALKTVTEEDVATGIHDGGQSVASDDEVSAALDGTLALSTSGSRAGVASGRPSSAGSHASRASGRSSLVENAARRAAFLEIMDVKRAQFKYRLNVLTQQCGGASQEYLSLMDAREELKMALRSADKRYRVLAAEFGVIRHFKGELIDSSIMHGKATAQRFEAPVLVDMVRTEMSQLWDTIAESKKGLVRVREGLDRSYAEKCRLEAAIVERRTAAEAFNRNFGNRGRMMAMVARIALRGLCRAWQGWRDYVQLQRRGKAALRSLVDHGLQRETAWAWKRWVRSTEKRRVKGEETLADERRRAPGGIGETALTAVRSQRTAAVDDAVALLSWLRHVEAQIAAGEASLHERLAIRDDGDAAAASASAAGGTATGAASDSSDPSSGSASLSIFKRAGALRVLNGGVPELGPAYDMTQPLPKAQHPQSRGPGGAGGGGKAAGADHAWMARGTDPPDGSGGTGGVPSLSLEAGPDADSAPSLSAILASAFDIDTNRDGGKALAAALVRAQGQAQTSTQVLNGRKAQALVAELGPDAVHSPLVRPALDAYLRQTMDRSWTYLSIGRYADSVGCLKRCEMVFGYRKDAVGLLAVYRMLSRLLERVGRFDYAMLHWERCKGMAKETLDALAAAEAAEGLGRCLARRAYHSEAMREFATAESAFTSRNDLRALLRLHRLQAASCEALDRGDDAARYRSTADAIEGRLASFMRGALDSLRGMQEHLYACGVCDAVTVPLEPCGPVMPLLRQQVRFLKRERRTYRAVLRATTGIRDSEAARVAQIHIELAAADATGALVMSSSVLDPESSPYLAPAPGAHGGNNRRSVAAQAAAGKQHLLSRGTSGKQYAVADLQARLRDALSSSLATIAECERDIGTFEQRVRNIDSEVGELRELEVAEGGDLARRVFAKRPLRALALNSANLQTNNVLGLTEGGYPRLVAVQDSVAFAYDSRDGACVSAFCGDSEATPAGEPLGHTKPITAVCLYGDRLYTGSQDCTVRAWDMDAQRGWGPRGPVEAEAERVEAARLRAALSVRDAGGNPVPVLPEVRDPAAARRKRAGLLLTMAGHSGSVTALAASSSVVVSGSVDRTIITWDAGSGAQLRVLRGHELSVTTLSVDDVTFASGGADGQVRMWHIESRRRGFGANVACRWRGLAHDGPITALSCVGREVVSGDAQGTVIVWDDETGTPLRSHALHPGRSIHALQFDAYKIVSSGGDGRLVVSDLFTGEPLQVTLAPHGATPIAGLQFDTDRLLTVAVDRSVKVWAWKGVKPQPSARTHLTQPGDSLLSVAQRYDVLVRQLRRWNGIRNADQFYEGKRLLIEAPDRDARAAALLAGTPLTRGYQSPQMQPGTTTSAGGADGVSVSVRSWGAGVNGVIACDYDGDDDNEDGSESDDGGEGGDGSYAAAAGRGGRNAETAALSELQRAEAADADAADDGFSPLDADEADTTETLGQPAVTRRGLLRAEPPPPELSGPGAAPMSEADGDGCTGSSGARSAPPTEALCFATRGTYGLRWQRHPAQQRSRLLTGGIVQPSRGRVRGTSSSSTSVGLGSAPGPGSGASAAVASAGCTAVTELHSTAARAAAALRDDARAFADATMERGY